MTEKKIVYESRARLIFILTVSWGFTAISIWAGYLWGLALFGLCALVLTYPLIDPKKRVIFLGTKESNQRLNKEFKDRLVDNGIFKYTDTGFIISLEEAKEVQWNQIQAIFGYKMDLMTIDEICIDMFCDNDISLRVTEETAGWFVFIERLKEKFPTIAEDWNTKIMQPAFATNLTLVYDCDNRNLTQAIELFYADDKKTE